MLRGPARQGDSDTWKVLIELVVHLDFINATFFCLVPTLEFQTSYYEPSVWKPLEAALAVNGHTKRSRGSVNKGRSTASRPAGESQNHQTPTRRLVVRSS